MSNANASGALDFVDLNRVDEVAAEARAFARVEKRRRAISKPEKME